MNDLRWAKGVERLRRQCPLLDEVVYDHRGLVGICGGQVVLKIEVRTTAAIEQFRDAYSKAVEYGMIKPKKKEDGNGTN